MFLFLQGYSFKVVTDLVPPETAQKQQLADRSSRLDLLAKLRSHAEAAEGVEKDDDEDGVPGKKPPGAGFRRRVGTLAEVSGADALYKEFSTAAGAAARAKGASIRKLVNRRRAA